MLLQISGDLLCALISSSKIGRAQCSTNKFESLGFFKIYANLVIFSSRRIAV